MIQAIFAVILVGLNVWVLWQIRLLKIRLSNSLKDTNGESLEKTLSEHMEGVAKVQNQLTNLAKEYSKLTDIIGLASQKISVVRFNPFGDTGGDQSFSLAVLDGHNSGYILTSIHGRQGTRIYVKPLDFGKSKYPLSKEENQALAQAMKRAPNQEGATINHG